jgi:hypothetical protein
MQNNITNFNASIHNFYTWLNQTTLSMSNQISSMNSTFGNYTPKSDLGVTNGVLTDLTNAFNKHVTNSTIHATTSSSSSNYLYYFIVIIIIVVIIILVVFKWK